MKKYLLKLLRPLVIEILSEQKNQELADHQKLVDHENHIDRLRQAAREKWKAKWWEDHLKNPFEVFPPSVEMLLEEPLLPQVAEWLEKNPDHRVVRSANLRRRTIDRLSSSLLGVGETCPDAPAALEDVPQSSDC